jgi:primosomal protein N' (replication factor Y)
MPVEEKKFVRVVVPSPMREFLIYRIPPGLGSKIKIGMRVLVPLGKRKVTGVVFDLLRETSLAETREIIQILDEHPLLDPHLLRLSQWIARYYLASVGDVVGTILPPSLRSESHRIVVVQPCAVPARSKVEQEILSFVRQKKGRISVKSLTRAISRGSLYQALERLETAGAIELRERLPGQGENSKSIAARASSPPSHPLGRFKLNSQQQQAWNVVEQRLQKGGFETFLIHGATGSGKTEVYLRAAERVRDKGLRSIILIPEISLTPQLLDRVHARFPGKVGVLHSALSGAERRSHWWRIARGGVDIVVGARSAVFAPLPDLGLIIVDEEHDTSYKQEDGLKYNARDVAVVRGKLLGCPVILGSATPAMESYENCLEGRYRLLKITERVQKRPLPHVEIVDLRRPFKPSTPPSSGPGTVLNGGNGYHRLISAPLAEAIKENFAKSQQTLIFLNRRGFSNFLQCEVCGYVLRCPYCSVTLTLHLQQKNVCCHHCNFHRPVPEYCPGCDNKTLSGVGTGTEQVERVLQKLVPAARLARMDRDTTRKRGAHEELIRDWERGNIDILVGTQMVTKGHDVSGVTLVGALLADLSLNLPDFRAAERTFQVLSQVGGRSGRGEAAGRVIIQTYAPDHYAIQHLVKHDYKGFFAAEIEYRRTLNYPPFGRLVNLRVEGPNAADVETKARDLAAKLDARQRRHANVTEPIEILGPAPAPIEKLRSRFRWQILLKGKLSSSLLELAAQAGALFSHGRSTRLQIDVDPYSML